MPTPAIRRGELEAALRAVPPPQVVDVRPPEGYRDGHLPGAFSIPLPRLPAEAFRLDPARPVVLYAGSRRTARFARRAAGTLRGLGFGDVRVYEDGVEGWRAAGLPLPPEGGPRAEHARRPAP